MFGDIPDEDLARRWQEVNTTLDQLADLVALLDSQDVADAKGELLEELEVEAGLEYIDSLSKS